MCVGAPPAALAAVIISLILPGRGDQFPQK